MPDTDEAISGVPRKAPSQQKFDKGRRVQRQPLPRRVDGVERRAGRQAPAQQQLDQRTAGEFVRHQQPAPTMAETVVRNWGSRQGDGQSPTVRA